MTWSVSQNTDGWVLPPQFHMSLSFELPLKTRKAKTSWTTPSSNNNHHELARPHRIDPKMKISLTFTALPIGLCPIFSLNNFQHFGDHLWDVNPLSSWSGLTGINFFLVSPPLVSLLSNFVRQRMAKPGFLPPPPASQVLLSPCPLVAVFIL